MNDFSELEAELKQLRPRATSPELAARVETALAHASTATATAGVLPRARRFNMNWFALGLGVAAAAAFLLLARVNVDRASRTARPAIAGNSIPLAVDLPAQPTSGFVPDGLTRVVYHTRDEGLVFPATTSAPVRRVRSRARETLQWRESGTGASLRVSYPTEEVELIPVSGQ